MTLKTLIPLSVLALLLIMQGCTSLTTFPTVARAGDTITVAVGSPDGMSRANTSVVFKYDSDGSEVDLTPGIRSIFKVYADPTSGVFQKIPGEISNQDVPLLIQTSGHSPWMSVIALDLPPGMNAGTGQLLVTSTAEYPTGTSDINDLQANGQRIDLEVLPGSGAPTVFRYEFGFGGEVTGELTRLEPVAHALVHPLFEGGGGPLSPHPYPEYGAIEVRMDLFTDVAVDTSSIRLATEDMQSATESRRSIAYGINNNNANPEMVVILTSPIGKLEYFEARFSLVPQDGINFTAPPVVTSVEYFDVNGNPSTGPAAGSYVVSLGP